MFFTSDTHFGHKNIIKYCNRPFATAQEMDEHLIAAWNAKVPQRAPVWHLGDFSFRGKSAKSYFDRLNGKISFVLGNHDKRRELEEIAPVFDIAYVHHNKRLFVLCHYAMRVWKNSHRGSFHLYGHSHGKLDSIKASMDVGVDAANNLGYGYAPLAIEELKL